MKLIAAMLCLMLVACSGDDKSSGSGGDNAAGAGGGDAGGGDAGGGDADGDAGGGADGGAGAGGAVIGDACTSEADCADEASCFENLPGGYCSLEPEPGIECPAGSKEIELDEGSACLKECADDSDCRAHECHYCDDDKACWAWPYAEDAKVDGPCTNDADCGADGVCLTDWDGTNFPGGTCAIDALYNCCPDGTDEAASEDGESLYCLKTCTVDADCRGPDYTCSAGKFCFPP